MTPRPASPSLAPLRTCAPAVQVRGPLIWCKACGERLTPCGCGGPACGVSDCHTCGRRWFAAGEPVPDAELNLELEPLIVNLDTMPWT